MSHLTSIKMTLTNRKYLLGALDRLGFTYKVAEDNKKLKTKGRYNQVTDVDILITGNGNKIYNDAIGFIKDGDTYTATGDFWGLKTKDGRSVTKDMLKKEVTAHSKSVEINDRLSKLQFNMDKSSYKETNTQIKFVMNRWQ